jgi:hypothetical protein
MLFKIQRQPMEQCRMAWWVFRIHFIHRMHDAAPHHECPKTVDHGTGKQWVVDCDRICKDLSAGEFGDGRFLRLLISLGRSDQVILRKVGIIGIRIGTRLFDGDAVEKGKCCRLGFLF